MAPLRIGVYHDLPSGGAKRALYQQVRGLVERGHLITVYLPSTADERFLPLSEIAHRVRPIARPAQPDRERALTGVPSPWTAVRWLRYLGTIRRSEREIARIVNADGNDVVLVAPSQFTQAPWVLRWLRTPSLYYCQEPMRAAYEARISSPPVRLAIRHTIGRTDRRNVRAATEVAANSKFSARNIERIYGRPAVVVPLGVDTDLFRPGTQVRGSYLLTVGALHPLKGLDFLIDALALVPLELRLPLLIVSDRCRDRERTRLERQARALGVPIEFHFRVPDERLVALYGGARLVLYAPYEEPFGLVPLEAMACGRPVLGIREGGVPETIQDEESGFLEDRDAARFAQRITALLLDPDAAEAAGKRGAEQVRERWTWGKAVDRLEEMCRRLATAEG